MAERCRGPGRTRGHSPPLPVVPRRIWRANGTTHSAGRTLGGCSTVGSEPQPTTVSHDGGCADRSGARVSRCIPTGLSHVAMLLTRASRVGRRVAVWLSVMLSWFRSNWDGGAAVVRCVTHLPRCPAVRHPPTATSAHFLRRLLALFFGSAWSRFVKSPWWG